MPAADSLGIYVSVPFCASKCSFCNFASDVFPQHSQAAYVDKLCEEIRAASGVASANGLVVPAQVDTIYFGGGTPGMLAAPLFARIAGAIRDSFDVIPNVEFTVECAPGQLSAATLDAMLAAGVNRVSFGVQSFVDAETRAVGRLHSREQTLATLAMVRAAGIANISLDLIAGLPLQTAASWQQSLDLLVETGVPHASVYMLEIDDESRLGREVLGGGARLHAQYVPSDDTIAAMYETACERLTAAGLPQYEISNFARAGKQSRHNLRYWTRSPYLGLGLDAHSMLRTAAGVAARFANCDSLDAYLAGAATAPAEILTAAQELEESLFLGLRMTRGVCVDELREAHGWRAMEPVAAILQQLASDEFLEQDGPRLCLTARGRMVSNEVFARLLNLEQEPAYA